MGLGSVGSTTTPRILKSFFGVDFTEVDRLSGQRRGAARARAWRVDGDCGAWSSIPADWLNSPKFHPLMRTAKNAPEGMSPDVPYIVDIAPDQRSRNIIRFLVADGELGRPFVASQAVPADRVAILRAAFAATVKDPEFIAAAKAQRLPVSPRSGEKPTRLSASFMRRRPTSLPPARRSLPPGT